MATGATCGRSAASGPGTTSKAGSLVVASCSPGASQPGSLQPRLPIIPPPLHLLYNSINADGAPKVQLREVGGGSGCECRGMSRAVAVEGYKY